MRRSALKVFCSAWQGCIYFSELHNILLYGGFLSSQRGLHMSNSQKSHSKIILEIGYIVGLNSTNTTRVIKIYTHSFASIFHYHKTLDCLSLFLLEIIFPGHSKTLQHNIFLVFYNVSLLLVTAACKTYDFFTAFIKKS